jgi:hypothetical protein
MQTTTKIVLAVGVTAVVMTYGAFTLAKGFINAAAKGTLDGLAEAAAGSKARASARQRTTA